jgi:hypothetical protein
MDRQCSNCTAPAVTAADNTTSCSNPLTFQMSDTEVVLEGEHFASTSAVGTGNSWSVTSISGGVASGDEVVALGPVNPTDFWTDVATVPTVAPRLVYSVNLTQSATYYVFIRGNDPDGVSGGDSCWAGFDNVPMSMTYFDFDDDAATWSWKSQSISLGAGVHTFHIWGREDGLRVDKIVINTTGTAPTGLGPAESARN